MSSRPPPVLNSLRNSLTNLHTEVAQNDLMRMQIQQAFLTTGSQLLALGGLVLLYYISMMLESCITPFFWALLVSVVLRRPKNAIMGYLAPLRACEQNGKGFFDVMVTKFYYCVRFSRSFFFSWKGGLFVLLLLLFCGHYGFFVLGVFLVLYLLTFVLLVLLTSEMHHMMVTVYLFCILIVFISLLSHFYIIKLLDELRQFGTILKNSADGLYQDKRLRELFIQYNITEVSMAEYLESAQGLLTDYLQNHGVNLSDVRSLLEDWSLDNNRSFDYWVLYNDLTQQPWLSSVSQVGQMVNADALTSTAKSTFILLFGTGAGILEFVGGLSSSFLGVVTDILVFFTSLYYLTNWEESVLDKMVEILPVAPTQKSDIVSKLQNSINRIFLCSGALCLSHGLTTYFFFKLFSLDFPYSATLLSAVIAILPFLPVWIVYLPVVFIVYIQSNPDFWQYLIGCGVVTSAMMFSDPYIYMMIPNSQPYLTGLAVVLGFSTFGIKGVVLGPMLIVFILTVYEIFTSSLRQHPITVVPKEKKEDKTKKKSRKKKTEKKENLEVVPTPPTQDPAVQEPPPLVPPLSDPLKRKVEAKK